MLQKHRIDVYFYLLLITVTSPSVLRVITNANQNRFYKECQWQFDSS